MTASEKNLAEDRLTRESDVQAHEERVRVSVPSYLNTFIELNRWVQTGCRGEILTRGHCARGEGSWSQQRQALDREIVDLAARYDYPHWAHGIA